VYDVHEYIALSFQFLFWKIKELKNPVSSKLVNFHDDLVVMKKLFVFLLWFSHYRKQHTVQPFTHRDKALQNVQGNQSSFLELL
jgi:hypothetical protein